MQYKLFRYHLNAAELESQPIQTGISNYLKRRRGPTNLENLQSTEEKVIRCLCIFETTAMILLA